MWAKSANVKEKIFGLGFPTPENPSSKKAHLQTFLYITIMQKIPSQKPNFKCL